MQVKFEQDENENIKINFYFGVTGLIGRNPYY